MKALTIIEPWLSCILYHGKDVENRSWRLPVDFLNKPIALHTSKKNIPIRDMVAASTSLKPFGIRVDPYLPPGCIVATAYFTKCELGEPKPPWRLPNLYHWHLKVTGIRETPIPARGALGFWEVPPELEFKIYEQLAESRDRSWEEHCLFNGKEPYDNYE